MRKILGLTVAVMFLLGACSDDTSAVDEAGEQVCDDRADVRSALDALGSALTSRNFGDAGDALADLQSSLGALRSSAAELSAEQRDEVQPQVDAIEEALGSIDLTQAGSVSEAFDQISTEIDSALDTIGENDSLTC